MTIVPEHQPMTCLACGGNTMTPFSRVRDIEYYTTPETFAYNRCAACSALSIDPVPEDRLGQIYPRNYYSFVAQSPSLAGCVKELLDKRMFQKVFQLADPERHRTSLSALDVGGGSGWLLNQAKTSEPRLKRTVVVDIDDKAETTARLAGHDYFCGRIEDYSTAEKFDLIVMLNLIEHVKDPVGMLRKAETMLSDNGRILIKTPNYDSLDARLFRHRHWGGYHCPRHWVLFTPESFERAATHAGVQIESLHLTQGAPFWTWSVLNMLKDMGLVDITAERPAYMHPLSRWLMLGFAAFDFLRLPFMRTSQMVVILKKSI